MNRRPDFQPYTRPKDRVERSRLVNFYHSQMTAVRSLTELFMSDFWSRLKPQRQVLAREWNQPLIIATVTLIVVLTPALYFWHRLQIQRQASALLSMSQKLEADQKYLDSAEYAFRYLRLRPDDGQARVHLAEVFDKGAHSFTQVQRSTSMLKEATGIEPGNPSLHRRLAKRYLYLRQFSNAVDHANELNELAPADPDGSSVKAVAEYQQAKAGGTLVTMEKAAQSYKLAVDVNPNDPSLALGLADIYRSELANQSQERRNELADTVLNRLVLNNPESSDALLARYEYRTKYKLQDADVDLDLALRMSADDVNVLLSAGSRAMRRGQYDEAVRYCQRVVEKDPTEKRGMLALGFAYMSAKKYEQALDVWRKGSDETRKAWRPGGVGPEHTAIMLHLGLNLSDLLIRMNRLDEADDQISIIERNIFEQTRELDLESSRELNDNTKFVRARWLAAKGDFYKAVPRLREVLVSMRSRLVAGDELDRLVTVHYQLAQCHAAQNQHDLAATVYDEVIKLQNRRAKHYLAAGVSYELAGLPEKAVTRYETGMNADDPPAELWVAMARAQMALQRNLGQVSGEWKPFEATMRRAAQLNANVSELAVLEAESMAARGDQSGALKRLHDALEKDSGSLVLWQTTILSEQMWGTPAEADRLLNEYQTRQGASMATQLLRVALLSQRSDFEGARTELKSAIELAPEIDRPKLLFQMAELSVKEGDLTAAREQLRELSRSGPENLQLLKLLGELALNENDLNDAQHWEDRLRSMEGNDGTAWRYLRARRLLAKSQSSTDREFSEATTLQDTVLTSRPSWPMGHILRGQIEERRGRTSDAIQAYQRAVDLGANDYALLERLISLLFEDNRIADADRFLSRLSKQGDFSSDMTQMAIDVSIRHNQLSRALELAEQAAKRRPNDPKTLIRYGQALLLAKRLDDALPVFLRATEHAEPEDTRPWMMLLSYYSQTEQMDEARATLERLLGKVPEDDPGRRDFVAGQGYELIRDFEAADAHYRKAMDLAPNNVGVQKQAANFFSYRDVQRAEDALRNVLKLEPASDVRRRLAMLLARRGGEKNWKEAVELLEAIERGAKQSSATNMRAQVYVLLERGGVADRRRALDLLEELVENERDIRDEDRVVLARLYEQEHLNSRAIDQYKALVTRSSATPEHVAMLADLLLKDGRTEDAETWIDQLQANDPKSFPATALRVRWLAAGKRMSEIDALVEPFMEEWLANAEGDEVRGKRCADAGKLFAEIKDADSAERWFAKGVEFSPAIFEPFAEWLSANGRVSDAMSVVLEASASLATSQPMITLAVLLAKSKAPPAEVSRAEELLVSAVEKSPKNVQMKLALANLRVMQSRNDDAEALYRKALEIEPDNVPALNNLATCLASRQEKQDEALEMIIKAMEKAGPLEILQDSQAMILLAQGKVQSSLSILGDLTKASSANGIRFLHLALAHQQAGSLEEARWALQQARDRKLADEVLTPREQDSLSKLEAALVQ